jgi:membrane fusion protein, multidrug efflux system
MTRVELVGLLMLLSCVSGVAVSGQGAAQTVETAKVIEEPLARIITIPGDLTAFQSVNLSARVAGFVESVAVDRGSWVKRGQALARVSAPELAAQRAEAEAKLQAVRAQQAEAEAKTVAAKSTFDRLKAASATPGVIAGHDVEIAERSFQAAQAHVDALRGSGAAAEAAAKAVSEMEAYLQLHAPFDGVITERTVHPGSLVGPSTGPLLRLEQVSRLRLTVPVPEAYVGSVSMGTKVEFRVTAFPDQLFQGTVARSAHSLDMKTRSMLVELDVANPRHQLASGMFAEVQWPISRGQASFFVPRTAVVRTTERQFVVRVRNGVAEWVDVRRGELDGDRLEVFGDLRAGDEVVRRGNDEIRHGARVAAVTGR